MITLHHLNNSKSQRIVWLLEELGLEYELVHHTREPTLQAPEEMKKYHPLGKSPIIDIDGHVMAESGAVVEYIVHRFGEGRLMPDPLSDDYAHYLEMLHYPEGSANTPFFLGLITAAFGMDGSPLDEYAKQQRALHLGYIDGLLESQDYLVGNAFTAADIQLTFILQGARARGYLDDHPRLVAYIERMEARPAYKAGIDRGGPFDLSLNRPGG
ncbi:MAG: glutathione S-transferase family protein [Alphaproteobacteria bacterium]|nr:glutathione S-transferase family protein [Alphaproteobacteria bacterium]